MIDIKELRIGNYVECASKLSKIVCIEENKFYMQIIENVDYQYKWYKNKVIEHKPIPITEEMLLNLGFDKNYKAGFIGIDAMGTNFVLNEPTEYFEYYSWHVKQGNVPLRIKLEYIHQLQNLYFALTGKELELKN